MKSASVMFTTALAAPVLVYGLAFAVENSSPQHRTAPLPPAQLHSRISVRRLASRLRP